MSQGASCELHQDLRGKSSAIPSSNQSQWPSQLLHEEGNLGMDRLPHEPNGKELDDVVPDLLVEVERCLTGHSCLLRSFWM